MVEAKGLLIFTTAYHGYRGNDFPPRFQRFLIQNISCKKAGSAIDAVGVEKSPLLDVTVRHVTVDSADLPLKVEHAKNFRSRTSRSTASRPACPEAEVRQMANFETGSSI